MDATWLADVLRAEGLHVIEMSGWKSRRTRPGFDPVGVVCHHTATGPDVADAQVRKLLVKGRPDLSGPLCQLGLERDGTFVVVAAGRCNHNIGEWGNDSIGVEAYNDGTGEPWPAAQMDAYRRGVAAICRHLGWGTGQVRGHKETDPGRKIDPTFDMRQFRADVAPLIFPPPTVQEDDDTMFSYEYVKDGQTVLRVVEGNHQTRLTGQALLAARRKSSSHLVVSEDDVARFDANYGSAG